VSFVLNDTYLVENYSPGMSADGLEAAGRRVRDEVEALARVGKRVRLLQAAVVPRDETLLCLVDAASEDLVREAFMRAGVSFDRISPALSEDAG
jgi:hypothetical protein